MKYGLIIVDLLKNCIVDLLPDRSAETVKNWLLRHPQVETVARDRSLELRQGISDGAPNAVQVADRFHLLQNLTDTLFKIVTSRYDKIKKVFKNRNRNAFNPRPVSPERVVPEVLESKSTVAEQRRRDRIETAHELHSRGWTVKAIAAEMGNNPKTISRYLRMTGKAWLHRRRQRGSVLDPYKPYLIERWSAGCRKGNLLYDEIKARGYPGKMTRLRDFLRQLKRGEIVVPGEDLQPENRAPRLSPRQLAFLLGRPAEALPPAMDELIQQLRAEDEQLDETVGLAREFTELINRRKSEVLNDWISRTKTARALPLRRFAVSLEGDLEAVQAALENEWSNGPTEGHINRLKMVKRQMYGRANLDLLASRLVGARPP
jgi:transposase